MGEGEGEDAEGARAGPRVGGYVAVHLERHNTVLVCDCDCDFVIKLVTKDAECDASLLQSDGQVKVTAL